MNPLAPTADSANEADARVTTLANGVRVVVFRLPQLATAAVSVFVRSGSQHESARLNGISHFIEHMAFKGTRTRSARASERSMRQGCALADAPASPASRTELGIGPKDAALR